MLIFVLIVLTVGGFGRLLLLIFSVGTAGDILELLPVVFVTVASWSPDHGGRHALSDYISWLNLNIIHT